MTKKGTKQKLDNRSATGGDRDLGKKIRLLRVEQRLSQADLGEALGVSFQQVQKYEKGVNRVSSTRLQQIATVLGVNVSFFYEGNKATREIESLLFLDSSFSMRLLRAYTKIKDKTVARHFVSLMESVAGQEEAEGLT